ncbi:MAG: 30S ribosomal protein S2 [Candidatus Lloydbacteria bacterium RIFCSPHIGHO2_02_FULL_54_17]|uniref:Small ribosomal subunit protein uS2 n=1 Tax=Candidatus Lloydbacteria bacterium RIFCSPHIGHO2_02_FULL_54_17 TaxID=1798664 RepID=A0A1G2DGE8_9BACT|nr:MAG: 30S ribosomal protein S2 [Candidatus Lloydbacteria bacterium RIFCSPHIGHO2_01_FULL_54_11]OGZ11848.1 MAG: 30S ribosomal protein S2 [Candidatus Lloydbacteria bacterium RIFCSPHIGHO2_02_FULL_54_17]OGZ14131.1 MAG: 30S ribosomal protein S2 [Candidatus Lloydbacteria bacterium RIFCSPLOWO2_01_FULL_54_18]OGZ16692.1 MAG: 30S ribosomal protein S2 [Candidatus Lloydbacteria bacterium RIFCSPLOWO2_02_FULL_54_12]
MSDTATQPDNATIEAMFNAGAHFGYSRARRHSSVRPYLYGAKNGVDIIDLLETVRMLETAKARLHELGKLGKTVLFVGTKPEINAIVLEVSKSIPMPVVTERWIGGTLTNWGEIKKRTARLKDLSDKFAKGELEKYTKKERLLFEREMAKLQTEFGGISALEGLPAAVVIVDPREEHIAVAEATKMKVEMIALLNSDCDASEITYPILANDSALKSVRYFLEELRGAYLEGAKQKA